MERNTTSRPAKERCHGYLLAGISLVLWTAVASAQEPFEYGGHPIHPGCIQALMMQQGDAIPVTTAVSLEGCAASERTKSEVQHRRDLFWIRDDALLGGGTFGYRVINQLDNGIYGLAIVRDLPDGQQRVSLAAVQLVVRPMIRHGDMVNLMLVELLGELWIPNIQLSSFQSIGNTVHFVSGVGDKRVERTVDFTRIGKERR